MRNQWLWKGSYQSEFVVVYDLWLEYIGSQPKAEDWLQTLEMLQESIRRCMRSEYQSYLNGKATRGRVAETRGHAILLGKIIANYKQNDPLAYQHEELVARGQVQPIADALEGVDPWTIAVDDFRKP